MGGDGFGEEKVWLFERKEARGRSAYKVFASTIFVGICLIWVYRLMHVPRAGEKGRWTWIGLFMAEFWFGLYWIITQSVRWNITYLYTFKDDLLDRYGDKFPGIDIFVCTADPTKEPPSLVINTILSVISYNYPPEKLSVYLSDDGCSELTFYALLEASHFSKYWIPFCKKFMVEPRSPMAYFADHFEPQDISNAQEWLFIKKLYKDMENRIESAVDMGCVSKDIRDQHKGFLEWNPKVMKGDHQSIVKILIDGRETNAVDNDGCQLPTLVYMAREKRAQWPHNFKAGAMNALIRVSSEISNGPIILNLDCDMYSNNPDAIQEALCFFMDEERGGEIYSVQFPQNYNNSSKNDIYASLSMVSNEIEFVGMNGYGAAFYLGTGCFHRREGLCGRKYSKDYKEKWNSEIERNVERPINELEEASQVLANCSYEQDTLWGKEMGLVYGCPVEDNVTGLSIQCRGWKSIYYNPDKKAFLGIGPTTLDQTLIQQKRWSEGLFQTFCSNYCPFLYGHGKIKLGAQMGYSIYQLGAANSLPTLYYLIVPSLCLLRGIPLFPKVTNLWFLPFVYVFVANKVYSLAEALSCKDNNSPKAWWNLQRMVVINRTTSYLFGFIDTITKQLGFSETAFAITAKVIDEDITKRYEQEIMEFGSSSLTFTIIATLAMLNLFSLVGGIMRLFLDTEFKYVEQLIPQIILCGLIVLINIPVYEALFIRSDKGKIPSVVMFKSIIVASLAYLIPIY